MEIPKFKCTVCLNLMVLLFIVNWCVCDNSKSSLTDDERSYLDGITNEEWLRFTELGIESINKQKRLEDNLINSRVIVENGSISHDLLLNSLPSPEVKEDNEVALKILKASLYAYNSKCVPRQLDAVAFREYLERKPLPGESDLSAKCMQILNSHREGHHPFRRLLPRNYKDGIYALNTFGQPPPREISSKALNRLERVELDAHEKSLAAVLWAQFIEHDLSKPVFQSMGNGHPIECCDKSNYRLAPRYYHPVCVPLLQKDPDGRQTCLSYVRSALAIGERCSFGSVEQVNQATGRLDLSQLYGFRAEEQRRMRSFRNGELKTSHSVAARKSLLPTAPAGERHGFCTHKPEENAMPCFMAGDSRVNTNEYVVLLYTLFLRNHNQIAAKLRSMHPKWTDEKLYAQAKEINTKIYRRITYDEWLPSLLGGGYANHFEGVFGTEEAMRNAISNEFAVAAIRFYYSMMPTKQQPGSETPTFVFSKLATANNLAETPGEGLGPAYGEFNTTMLNLLFDNPSQMDGVYEKGWIPEDTLPTHSDILAFDIQRGRDHGLQPYHRYLQKCVKAPISDWHDLSGYMESTVIENLQSMYDKVQDIDLIVGGISEIPFAGSTVGPTFTCILAEQFRSIRRSEGDGEADSVHSTPETGELESMAAVDVMCANSMVNSLQANVFRLPSSRNPYVQCSQRKRYF